MTAVPTTTLEIKEALRRQFSNVPYLGRERYAYFEELRTGTGYNPESMQSIDAWVMNLWPGDRYGRRAYEIKVSRSDFRKELGKPLKRRMGLLLCNQFYFVAPLGLIKPEEVPIECGLEEVADFGNGKWTLKETVPAPWRDTGPPPWSFVASLARRVSRLEQ